MPKYKALLHCECCWMLRFLGTYLYRYVTVQLQVMQYLQMYRLNCQNTRNTRSTRVHNCLDSRPGLVPTTRTVDTVKYVLNSPKLNSSTSLYPQVLASWSIIACTRIGTKERRGIEPDYMLRSFLARATRQHIRLMSKGLNPQLDASYYRHYVFRQSRWNDNVGVAFCMEFHAITSNHWCVQFITKTHKHRMHLDI